MQTDISSMLDAANEGADSDAAFEAASQSVVDQLMVDAKPNEPVEKDVATLPQAEPEPTPEPQLTESEKEPEPEVDSAKDPEPEPEATGQSAADALFAQLRQQFPNEPLSRTAKRVEDALGSNDVQEAQDGPDAFTYIRDEYAAKQAAVEEAQKIQDELVRAAEENGTVLEFNPETRKAFEDVLKSQTEAVAAYKELQLEAFAKVEDEFPELTQEGSVARKILARDIRLAAQVNPNFDAHDPTLAAFMAREAALEAKSLVPAKAEAAAAPARKQAAPGPRAPQAPLSSAVQAKNAAVGSPPNGPAKALSISEQIGSLAPGQTINDLLDNMNGGASTSFFR